MNRASQIPYSRPAAKGLTVAAIKRQMIELSNFLASHLWTHHPTHCLPARIHTKMNVIRRMGLSVTPTFSCLACGRQARQQVGWQWAGAVPRACGWGRVGATKCCHTPLGWLPSVWNCLQHGSHTWNTFPKLLLISSNSYPKGVEACVTPDSSLSWPQSLACCKWGRYRHLHCY